MALLIPILVFGTVVLLVIAFTMPGEDTVFTRMQRYGYVATNPRQRALSQPLLVRLVLPTLGRLLTTLGNALTPSKVQARASQRLEMAGHPISIGAYMTLRTVLMFGLPLVYFLMVLGGGSKLELMQIGILLASFWMGGKLPDMWINMKVKARRHKVERALPDALDLITVSVEAGQALDSAFARVAERTVGPLADEIRRMLHEMTIGKLRRDALRDMGQRSGVPDLLSFTAALVQSDKMGVSIADTLRAQSDTMRVRRRQRAEELAMTAPVKMLFPLIFCIFPALLIVVLGPAALKIMEVFSQNLAT